MTVNALLIRSDRLHTQAALFHHKLLAVTGSAGCRNVGVVHARLGITCRQQCMRASVAIDTSSRLVVPAHRRLRMIAALIRGLLFSVTCGAGNSLRRPLMKRALYIRVAIHTGEHAAVDGIFKCLRIDVQADGFAVHLMRQGSVAVASETFVSCWFGWVFLGGGVKRARC